MRNITTKILQIFLMTMAMSFIFSGCVSMRTSTNAEPGNTETAGADKTATPQGVDASDGSAKMQNEIRKIDFKNFTYEPYCASEDAQKLAVKKGEYSKDQDDDKIFFNVGKITYGDLNNDGQDEAIILTYCNTGGSGNFSEGFIYTMADGKPKLMTRIPGGDRADGGLASGSVENGLLVVVTNDAGETGGACCPEFAVTTKYKVEGKELKQVGPSSKKALYPEERVQFAKGSTRSIAKVKVDEIKRFVIGAQKGQVLSVMVDNKNVSLDLTKGEAEVSNDNNSLTATLKEDGDYVIQLQNSAAKPTEVILTIEIQ